MCFLWFSYKDNSDQSPCNFDIGCSTFQRSHVKKAYHKEFNSIDFMNMRNKDTFCPLKVWIYIYLINNKITLLTEDCFSYHNGMMFTTKDSDNDKYDSNCAASYGNGWWFNACHYTNLNGIYYKKPKNSSAGMTWVYWGSKSAWDSLKTSRMMIRSWLFYRCSVGW